MAIGKTAPGIGSALSAARNAKVRGALSLADSPILATFKGAHDADALGGPLNIEHKSAIAIHASLSVAAEFVTLRPMYFGADAEAEDIAVEPMLGDEITLRATPQANSAARLLSPIAIIPTYDWPLVRLLVTVAPATGNVDIFASPQQ